MTLQQFIHVLQTIENGGNPKVEYNLHEGIKRIFGALGDKPSYFFKDLLSAKNIKEES